LIGVRANYEQRDDCYLVFSGDFLVI